MQTEFLERALRFAEHRDMSAEEAMVLEMWQHCLEGIANDPMDLVAECDWVAKRHLIDGYMGRHNLPLSDPAVALVDLQYHDVDRRRGLFYRMQDRGLMERSTTDAAVEEAMANAPVTTRARLRGEFIKRAKERKRDYTVDWVHLKLNDQAQRTVLCKDPFKSQDDRVQKLIDSL
jgi:proteasome accessory factor A